MMTVPIARLLSDSLENCQAPYIYNGNETTCLSNVVLLAVFGNDIIKT